MFYALAKDKIDTGRFRFEHELVDIETLNRRAFAGELELTALSLHAYAYLADKYVLCTCGASMGDNYGPMVVAREAAIDRVAPRQDDRRAGHADHGVSRAADVPGQRLSARRRAVRPDSRRRRAPASTTGQKIDAGLIIHEGQLTYGDQNLHAGRRSGPMVDERDGPAAAAGGQRHSQGPGPGGHPRGQPPAQGEHSLRPRPSAGRPSTTPCSSAAASTAARPTSSSACTSTTGRSTSASAAARPCGELLARGHAAGVIPKLVEPEFVA